MERSFEKELLDDLACAPETRREILASLGSVHRLLLTHRWVITQLRRSQASSVLDIGSGNGMLVARILEMLNINATGVDLVAPLESTRCKTLVLNAVTDPLPQADAGVAVFLAHHLSEEELRSLIHNAARSVRSLIVVDPVRNWLPLLLFRLALCPWLHPGTASDGLQSIHRAYTAKEFQAIIGTAAAASGGRWHHWVAPLRSWQAIEIQWQSSPCR
jgi:SAM-dependent methyltransferase